MLKLRTAARLSVTIGLLAGVMAWVAVQLHLVPSPANFEQHHRVAITKTISTSIADFIAVGRLRPSRTLKNRVNDLAAHDPLIKCIVIRNRNGDLIAASDFNISSDDLDSTPANDIAEIDIRSGNKDHGKIEVHFQRNAATGIWAWVAFPYNLFMFTIGSVALITWLMFSRTFKYLNPTNIVPQRVRSAFDTLTEGVVLLNQEGEIVHSNQAFQKIVAADEQKLIGTHIADFQWIDHRDDVNPASKWLNCMTNRKQLIGQLIGFGDDRGDFKFSVNASPIISDKDQCRGALISFDDITDSEAKQVQLAQTIKTIEEQNEKLLFLASYDTLTECLNRAPFLEFFNKAWKEIEPEKLSMLMVDVDHFKSINDTHGHSFGDTVLKMIGKTITETVGDRGSVCRYGGEEFVVLIPNFELERAVDIAHEVHRNIESNPIQGISVTASIGFSNRLFKAMDPQHLLDQADQCLYAAKHLGRNRVVRFDQCPKDIATEDAPQDKRVQDKIQNNIEYSSVMGLLSALSFRCHQTANHSVRVAKLAVKIGQVMLNHNSLYRLEMAALMHDIGKIGVPDSILYKPSPLTKEQWKVMKRHDEIGLQIVRNTFTSNEIARTIQCCQYWFSKNDNNASQKLFGKGIPVMARIIYVCDVFDTMIHDRVYRKGMPIPAALKELQECSPAQFDPEVIQTLIQHVNQNGYDLENEQSLTRLDPRSAAIIGGHIETIYAAMVDNDWPSLLSTTEDLRKKASEVFATNLVDSIDDLKLALSESQNDDDIKILAIDVIDLCREARGAMIDVSQAIKTEARSELI